MCLVNQHKLHLSLSVPVISQADHRSLRGVQVAIQRNTGNAKSESSGSGRCADRVEPGRYSRAWDVERSC